jgi:hypothetical protein
MINISTVIEIDLYDSLFTLQECGPTTFNFSFYPNYGTGISGFETGDGHSSTLLQNYRYKL